MVQILGRDYIEAPLLVANALQNLATARTLLPLASSQGTLTYLTERIQYDNQLINSLPCVIVDINPATTIPYRYMGTELARGVPLVIVLMTPVTAYLDDVVDAADRDARILAADTDIKTMLGDLEEVMNSEPVRLRIGKHLEIQRAGIAFDEFEFEENTHIHARVAEMWLTAWSYVKNQ